jgi:hypothetical protein
MGVVGFRPMEQLETQFALASYPKVSEAATADGAESTPDAATDAARDAASDAA